MSQSADSKFDKQDRFFKLKKCLCQLMIYSEHFDFLTEKFGTDIYQSLYFTSQIVVLKTISYDL